MQQSESEIAPAEPNGGDGAVGLPKLASLLRGLHRAEATGEMAELRRMDHTETPPAAFFRLMARADFSELSDVENIRRWVAAVHVMAQRPDALRTDIELGAALHGIGLSEQRLDMLLNARGSSLFDLVRRVSLRLARAEEAMPYRDLCRLLLLSGPKDHVEEQKAERLRIQIAQSYVRAALRASGNSDRTD
jgi:CRISPR type I-E-associated protein CasB/Cse2